MGHQSCHNLLTEIIGALTVSMVTILDGILRGFATIALPNLELNDNEGSWFAALAFTCGIIFTPFGGLIAGTLGRKKTLMMFSPMVSIGWLLIASSNSKIMLFLGRISTSIATYSMLATPNAYISETVHPDVRATLASIPGFAMSVGLSTIWILGYFSHWRTIAYLSSIIPLVMVLVLWYLPESPYWLIEQSLDEDLAGKSLQFFRHPEYDVTDEIKEIYNRKSDIKSKDRKSLNWIFSQCFSVKFWKPFSCIGIIWSLNMLSGFPALTNYLIPIMEESGSDFDPSLAPMIIGILRLVIAFGVPFIVQKMHPKTSFVIGQGLKALSMGVIGTYFAVHYLYPESSKFSWIPLAMIIFQFYIRSVTILPVLYTLVGELFPTEIRALGVGMVQSSYFASAALIVKLYPDLKSVMGLHGLLYFYMGIGILNTIWGYLTIPDNRSKTLTEVEETMYDTKTPLIKK